MIRKTDKYLLLFILMIVLSLKLNAESSKHFSSTANCQPPTVNGQRSTVNGQRKQDTLPILKPDTLSSGVIVIPPTQGRLFIVGNIDIQGNRVTKSFTITRELPFKSGDSLTLQQLSIYFVPVSYTHLTLPTIYSV